MDLGLVAAAMTRARAGDPQQYEGCEMFSALPGAPTVDASPSWLRWSRRARAWSSRLLASATDRPMSLRPAARLYRQALRRTGSAR